MPEGFITIISIVSLDVFLLITAGLGLHNKLELHSQANWRVELSTDFRCRYYYFGFT